MASNKSSASTKRQPEAVVSDSENQQPPSNKRPKKSPSDDLICPINLELPWDPVIAEDGRVYEKESIEEHIEKNPEDLRSPITNEKMGRKLLSAIWVRNHIDTLVESGVIDGDLADKWNEKVKQKKDMEKLLKKAEAGDADAMYDLGLNYHYGIDGFKENDEEAFQWYRRAHGAKNARGTASIGYYYLHGLGVDKCIKRGVMYMSIAAGQGSDFAAYHLGMALAEGRHGMIVDKAEATRWLEEALGGCKRKHMKLSDKNKAQEKLNELKGQVSD
ncbi:Sel1 domain protein repeat-containing protein [Seminavis robusta]|uniref:Sel1 domain protein repeat-containing protein n=1 Tax=Seminavis robusta TaxID=568900 RepID=A0A9N8EH35_9STRA|nr:Sel1 domain protein repeat-containing protein [Seminavis robusta]|eukprot:Sro1154_g247160.1 Sel1 domain protein repeat-containing protein (274) ;mRNA; f:17071-17892